MTLSVRYAKTTTSLPWSARCQKLAVGDVLVIHDAGAHGRAMGFNYNGKLRPAELLLVRERRRAAYPPRRNAR